MTLSNYGFMAALLAFFIAGSKVTKWQSSYKRRFEADFKEGCNSAAVYAVIFCMCTTVQALLKLALWTVLV